MKINNIRNGKDRFYFALLHHLSCDVALFYSRNLSICGMSEFRVEHGGLITKRLYRRKGSSVRVAMLGGLWIL